MTHSSTSWWSWITCFSVVVRENYPPCLSSLKACILEPRQLSNPSLSSSEWERGRWEGLCFYYRYSGHTISKCVVWGTCQTKRTTKGSHLWGQILWSLFLHLFSKLRSCTQTKLLCFQQWSTQAQLLISLTVPLLSSFSSHWSPLTTHYISALLTAAQLGRGQYSSAPSQTAYISTVCITNSFHSWSPIPQNTPSHWTCLGYTQSKHLIVRSENHRMVIMQSRLPTTPSPAPLLDIHHEPWFQCHCIHLWGNYKFKDVFIKAKAIEPTPLLPIWLGHGPASRNHATHPDLPFVPCQTKGYRGLYSWGTTEGLHSSLHSFSRPRLHGEKKQVDYSCVYTIEDCT